MRLYLIEVFQPDTLDDAGFGELAGEACTKVQAENHPLARCIEPSLPAP